MQAHASMNAVVHDPAAAQYLPPGGQHALECALRHHLTTMTMMMTEHEHLPSPANLERPVVRQSQHSCHHPCCPYLCPLFLLRAEATLDPLVDQSTAPMHDLCVRSERKEDAHHLYRLCLPICRWHLPRYSSLKNYPVSLLLQPHPSSFALSS